MSQQNYFNNMDGFLVRFLSTDKPNQLTNQHTPIVT